MSLEREINEIKERLILIEVKLDKLLNIQDNIVKSNERLNTHIDFIEDTYSTLKTPLDFISNKFTRLTGVTSKLIE